MRGGGARHKLLHMTARPRTGPEFSADGSRMFSVIDKYQQLVLSLLLEPRSAAVLCCVSTAEIESSPFIRLSG